MSVPIYIQHKRLYNTWADMKRRCNNKDCKAFKNYGGRGICVSERFDKFKGFLSWALSSGYEDHLTIDRIDNDGHYTPENCRWATRKEQGANRRNSVYVEIDGVTKLLEDWINESPIPNGVIKTRFYGSKWNLIDSLTIPVKKYKRKARKDL